MSYLETRTALSNGPQGIKPLKQKKELHQWRSFEPTWVWHWFALITTIIFSVGALLVGLGKIDYVPLGFLLAVLCFVTEVLRTLHKNSIV